MKDKHNQPQAQSNEVIRDKGTRRAHSRYKPHTDSSCEIDFDAAEILSHREDTVDDDDDGKDTERTRYLVRWADCKVPSDYLERHHPDALLRWKNKQPVPASGEDDEVLREQFNGAFVCRWAPSWTFHVSTELLASYSSQMLLSVAASMDKHAINDTQHSIGEHSKKREVNTVRKERK